MNKLLSLIRIRSFKCGKCGVENFSHDGKCNGCGEFVYQFYQQAVRTKVAKIGSALLILGGLSVAVIFSVQKTSFFGLIDPIKKDLRHYLKQIESAHDYLGKTQVAKDYVRFIQKEANEKDKLQILRALGLSEEPSDFLPNDATPEERQKLKDYQSATNAYMEKVAKSLSLTDRLKLNEEVFEIKYMAYTKISCQTQQVRELHNHLLKATRARKDAQEEFNAGIELGYITNIRLTNDGTSMQWRINTHGKEYSENYKEGGSLSEEETVVYHRMLAEMVEQKGLSSEYLGAFPDEWLKKWLITGRVK